MPPPPAPRSGCTLRRGTPFLPFFSPSAPHFSPFEGKTVDVAPSFGVPTLRVCSCRVGGDKLQQPGPPLQCPAVAMLGCGAAGVVARCIFF